MDAFKHAVIRLYLYLLFSLFFITGGLAMFVLFPLYKGAFAPKASYQELRAFRIWAYMYKIMWRSLSNPTYRDMYDTNLADPPKLHTDINLVSIKDSWQGAEDNCDICNAACCMRLKCPLLGENYRCLSYGSLFFSYFYCGRYPENQRQIDYYDCPKWRVHDGV